MSQAILITGANAGDAPASLAAARVMIADRIGEISVQSQVAESEPWGEVRAEVYGRGCNDGERGVRPFVNQILVVETALAPRGLLEEIRRIETELGRRRPAEFCREVQALKMANDHGRVYNSRTMDIDILFYDDLVMDTPALTIPHPLIAQRGFVLLPLAEAMPGHVHPVLGRTAGELLKELEKRNEYEQ